MYGITIKRIREDKNLPLKSVYLNICSKTNVIKFEKGERTLAADKFNEVLANLMISMDEFLWINNDFKPSKVQYQRYMISHTWNANQLSTFEQRVKEAEKDQYDIQRIHMASFRILNSYSKGMKPSEHELSIVVNYFSNLSLWTLEDVHFFANNCYIIPYQLMKSLLKEMMKVKGRYTFYRDGEFVFARTLSNCIDRMISEGDIASAESYLETLNGLTSGVMMNGFKLLENYYKAKINFLYYDNENGRLELSEIVKIAKFMENEQLIEEIQQLLS